jgi:PAS domain S-box-containing protein
MSLAAYVAMAELLDMAPTTLYCVKDTDGRYLAVNNAFVERTNATSRRDVVGRLATDLFPAELADRYLAQDREIFELRQPLRDELEQITDPGGQIAWYLTTKQPIFDGDELVAIAVVSIALGTPAALGAEHPLRPVVTYLREHLAEPMTVDGLAEVAGLPLRQFERLIRRTFGLPTKQYITQVRVTAAGELLKSTQQPLAEIATRCGWYDQSAFSKQFTKIVGVTPGEYRRRTQPV